MIGKISGDNPLPDMAATEGALVFSEIDVLNRLLTWASERENVRALVLNGSRGDPKRVPDEFSDFDIAGFVRDPELIMEDDWLGELGEIMVRWPLRPQPTFDPAWITQLVLFSDGVRIDFQFTSTENLVVECPATYLCVLVDKDNLSARMEHQGIPGTSIQPPTEEEFADRINAFWWDIPYVAKALHRGEIDYARFSLDCDIRFNKLHPLMRWHVGARHGWAIDVGIHGRWFERYVEPVYWNQYLETFAGADIEENWRALFAAIQAVRALGKDLAGRFGYDYPDGVDAAVTQYIERIQNDDPGD